MALLQVGEAYPESQLEDIQESMNLTSRIRYFTSQGASIEQLLPHDVHVSCTIIDVSACVKSTQTFHSSAQFTFQRARYVFPLPPNASVCSFNMRTTEGYVVDGVVRRKLTGDRPPGSENNAASEIGVFAISLGDIPQCERMTVTLAYVVDLMDPDLEGQVLRFKLPRSVAPEHNNLVLPRSSQLSNKFKVVLDIQMGRRIFSVESPSHPGLQVSPYWTSGGTQSHQRVLARYESDSLLTRDFDVTIRAEGLDNSRCFAQRDNELQCVTMHLTLIPNFKLPDVKSQEYIFLLDRSGSMSGSRIAAAKHTLISLLQSLPAEGTLFNIFSFGTINEAVHTESISYNHQSLNQSKQSVDRMGADLGGTQLCPALENIFRSRNQQYPTAVFVVTDGEAFDIEEAIVAVAQAVEHADSSAPVRVFIVGIGEEVPLAQCEGIARAGNGLCLMATTTDDIRRKCLKLLRASRTFILKNVWIDWGVPRGSANNFPELIYQVPNHIEAIYPGRRFVANAVVAGHNFVIPKEVVIWGQRDGKGEMIGIRVPVIVIDGAEEGQALLINTLAARRYIDELGDTKNSATRSNPTTKARVVQLGERYQLETRYTTFFPIAKTIPRSNSTLRGRKADILRAKLALVSKRMRNRLSSPVQRRDAMSNQGPSEPAPQGSAEASNEVVLEADGWEPVDDGLGTVESLGNAITSPVGVIDTPIAGPSGLPFTPAPVDNPSLFLVRTNPPQDHYFPQIPYLTNIEYPSLASPVQREDEEICEVACLDGELPSPRPTTLQSQSHRIQHLLTNKTADSPSTTRNLTPSKAVSPWWKWKPCPMFPPGPTRRNQGARGISLATALPHLPVVLLYNAPDTPFAPKRATFAPAPFSKVNRVEDLITLQEFNGSFSLSSVFVDIVGEEAVAYGKSFGADDAAWAAALAIIYMQRNLVDEPDKLALLVEKTMSYGNRRTERTGGKGMDALLEEAERLNF